MPGKNERFWIRIAITIIEILFGRKDMQTIITQRGNGSRRVQILVEGESKTEQSHKKQVNINTIIAKTKKTGLFPTRTETPKYGNFTTNEDYQSAQNSLIQAQEDFMSLPSDIRKRFDNDPGNLIAFVSNPNNAEEAIEMGLLPKPLPKAPESPPAVAQEPETPPQKPAEPKAPAEPGQ